MNTKVMAINPPADADLLSGYWYTVYRESVGLDGTGSGWIINEAEKECYILLGTSCAWLHDHHWIIDRGPQT